MRKGQSAMEYLMTYGWAILIVVIVGAVLWYYGVFSPGTMVGSVKSGFGTVDVQQNWDFKSDGTLLIRLENKAGEQINVTGVEFEGVAKTTTPSSIVMAAGEQSTTWMSIATGSTGTAGNAYSIDVAIKYILTSAPGQTLTSSGTLSGKRS